MTFPAPTLRRPLSGTSSAFGAGGPRQLRVSTTGGIGPSSTVPAAPGPGSPPPPLGEKGARAGRGGLPGRAVTPPAPGLPPPGCLLLSPQLFPGAAAGRTNPSGLGLAARTGACGSCCWGGPGVPRGSALQPCPASPSQAAPEGRSRQRRALPRWGPARSPASTENHLFPPQTCCGGSRGRPRDPRRRPQPHRWHGEAGLAGPGELWKVPVLPVPREVSAAQARPRGWAEAWGRLIPAPGRGAGPRGGGQADPWGGTDCASGTQGGSGATGGEGSLQGPWGWRGGQGSSVTSPARGAGCWDRAGTKEPGLARARGAVLCSGHFGFAPRPAGGAAEGRGGQMPSPGRGPRRALEGKEGSRCPRDSAGGSLWVLVHVPGEAQDQGLCPPRSVPPMATGCL